MSLKRDCWRVLVEKIHSSVMILCWLCMEGEKETTEKEGRKEAMVKDLSSEQLIRVKGEEDKLFMVAFYAPWCQVCPMQLSYVHEVAGILYDSSINIEFFLCNVGEPGPQRQFAKELNIQLFPANVFIRDGGVVGQMTGVQRADVLIIEALRLS